MISEKIWKWKFEEEESRQEKILFNIIQDIVLDDGHIAMNSPKPLTSWSLSFHKEEKDKINKYLTFEVEISLKENKA